MILITVCRHWVRVGALSVIHKVRIHFRAQCSRMSRRSLLRKSAGNSSFSPNRQVLAPRCRWRLKITLNCWVIVDQNCWIRGQLHRQWMSDPTADWHFIHNSDKVGFILCLASGVIKSQCKILNCLSKAELDTRTLEGWLHRAFQSPGSIGPRSNSHLPFTLSELSALRLQRV